MVIGIIEDDEAVRDSLRALLESHGYEVRAFESAESYLASARAELHCIVVDQHMPGICGLELIERLRAAGNGTPAIMLTGHDDFSMRARAAKMGITIFRKPVQAKILLATLAQVAPR